MEVVCVALLYCAVMGMKVYGAHIMMGHQLFLSYITLLTPHDFYLPSLNRGDIHTVAAVTLL